MCQSLPLELSVTVCGAREMGRERERERETGRERWGERERERERERWGERVRERHRERDVLIREQRKSVLCDL